MIANRVFRTRGKVAIYGWHKPDGKPIQPLYTGHMDVVGGLQPRNPAREPPDDRERCGEARPTKCSPTRNSRALLSNEGMMLANPL